MSLSAFGLSLLGKLSEALHPSHAHFQGTEYKFAMKTLDKHEMQERNKVQRVLTEAQVLSVVDHPFLPTLYCTLQTDTHLHFVMEFCDGGELYGLLNSQPKKRLKEVGACWGGGGEGAEEGRQRVGTAEEGWDGQRREARGGGRQGGGGGAGNQMDEGGMEISHPHGRHQGRPSRSFQLG